MDAGTGDDPSQRMRQQQAYTPGVRALSYATHLFANIGEFVIHIERLTRSLSSIVYGRRGASSGVSIVTSMRHAGKHRRSRPP
jgi:hypothetical protein